MPITKVVGFPVISDHNDWENDMDTIIEIDGSDLEALINVFINPEYGTIYKLRVHTDGDVAKFKVNEGIWSPPLGHLDPMCTAAQLRRPFPM